MKAFTAARTDRHPPSAARQRIYSVLGALFWVAVWAAAAAVVGRELLVASPLTVLKRMWAAVITPEFWLITLSSMLRIVVGYLAGLAAGCLLGLLEALLGAARHVISPAMTVIRATPVASFIILALVWMQKDSIPALISFLMVTPIVCGNMRAGVGSVSRDLTEVCEVYSMPLKARLKCLWLPSLKPYFLSAAVTSLGLAWKAGIAAEVICTPANSIGRELYESKLYLDTPELFMWTLTVILLSLLLEKLLGAAVRVYGIKKTGNIPERVKA